MKEISIPYGNNDKFLKNVFSFLDEGLDHF